MNYSKDNDWKDPAFVKMKQRQYLVHQLEHTKAIRVYTELKQQFDEHRQRLSKEVGRKLTHSDMMQILLDNYEK